MITQEKTTTNISVNYIIINNDTTITYGISGISFFLQKNRRDPFDRSSERSLSLEASTSDPCVNVFVRINGSENL